MENDLVFEFENSLIAAKVAARVRPDPKLEVLPPSEIDEVNKHLVAAQWIVKEWVIRANQAQHHPNEYASVSQDKLRAITKFRDNLNALQDLVGPSSSFTLYRLSATPKRITRLNQLSTGEPTKITAETEVEIPGYYIEWDGNGRSSKAPGARWTLRDNKNDARLRDLVIVKG